MARISLKRLLAISGLAVSLFGVPMQATEVVFSFDTAPTFEAPQSGGGPFDPLADGEWGTLQDGSSNLEEIPPVPMWNPGGWIQPIGTESPSVNRGAVGFNSEGLNTAAIKANVFTGVLIYNETAWGDVSTATHVTLDVKGSFAGSGGLTVNIVHDEDITVFGESGTASWWSWGANATDDSVGLNPGDVTEWTTVLIPINRPSIPNSGNSPPDPGESGAFGNWGPFSSPFESWDSVFADVNLIAVRGITPDTQIDNIGFVLPDTGTNGDYNDDGVVNAADYTVWLDNLGAAAGALPNDGDGGSIGQAQYDTWKANFGTGGSASANNSAIPEPCSAWLIVCGAMTLLGARRQFCH